MNESNGDGLVEADRISPAPVSMRRTCRTLLSSWRGVRSSSSFRDMYCTREAKSLSDLVVDHVEDLVRARRSGLQG